MKKSVTCVHSVKAWRRGCNSSTCSSLSCHIMMIFFQIATGDVEQHVFGSMVLTSCWQRGLLRMMTRMHAS